jgi:hypothetical protein
MIICFSVFGGAVAAISLLRLNPAIGIKQYNIDVNRNMVAGRGWVEYLDMHAGNLIFDKNAQQGNPNTQNYSSTRRLAIRQNGNVVVNDGEANATRRLFSGQ